MSFTLPQYHAPDFTQPMFQNAPSVTFHPAPRDGVAPEGYHATSIYPEYFKVDGAWLLAEESRMDCVAALRGGKIAVVEFRNLKAGEPVAVGRTEDGSQGFLKEVISETGTASEFVSPEFYNIDEEYCYIDTQEDSPLHSGDFVRSPAGEDRYQIGPTKPLEGVYNINKGYAVFKRIEVLEQANDYCIVKKNTSYGLSVYDHIVLDAQTVNDGQLIYR